MSAKVIVITGASSGIGYETALTFAKNGANVVATARRVDKLQTLANAVDALPTPHGAILCVAADVQKAEDMQRVVAETLARFGRLDVLIANAGVGQRGSVLESEWADMDMLLRTNIDGVLHSIRAAVPAMKKGGGGQILLTSSVTYVMTLPYSAVYAASKAFVSSLANSLRLELEADHIAVTDMIIGRTETEFSEKRLGKSGRAEGSNFPPPMTAADVAKAIVRATEKPPKQVTVRWLDRLIVLASRLFPEIVGRRAMRQYK